MTNREAIEELRKIRQSGAVIPQKRAQAIDKAVWALKKQIPMKPIKRIMDDDDHPVCPVCPLCGVNTPNPKWLYPWEWWCTVCGQAIDWSEEE